MGGKGLHKAVRGRTMLDKAITDAQHKLASIKSLRQEMLADKTLTADSRILRSNMYNVLEKRFSDDLAYWEKQKASLISEVAIKEPWQMTREEYFGSMIVQGRWAKVSIQDIPKKGKEALTKFHREEIQQALARGKPVPAEVLKDYPELALILPEDEVAAKLGKVGNCQSGRES